MGHNIQAIVAKKEVDKDLLARFDLPCAFHGGFSIIGLNAAHSDFWAQKLTIQNESYGHIILNCPATHYFAKQFGLVEYAVIYTDYFGGVGEQYATVLSSNQVVMKETENGINEALKMIGVLKKSNMDEFDTICLGHYRSFDDNFEKYY